MGTRTVSLATVTARGEPRVVPVSSVFMRGRYYIPTVVNAARSRHLRQRPGLSLSDYEGNHLAVIIHGRAALIGPDDPEFSEADALFTRDGNQGPRAWGGAGPLYIRVDPNVMYTHASDPGRYPE